MLHIHPLALNLDNGYFKDIQRHSGRHKKKASGRPYMRKYTNVLYKDTNASNILLSSDNNSDRAGNVQAQIVHKVTIVHM